MFGKLDNAACLKVRFRVKERLIGGLMSLELIGSEFIDF